MQCGLNNTIALTSSRYVFTWGDEKYGQLGIWNSTNRSLSVNIDDVVELWGLADMYQLEGLKWTCMSSWERGVYDENVSPRILQKTEDLLDCGFDEYIRESN